jgi:RHS repeat-associated protein
VYVQQDANYNVTSISDINGNVLERYIYDPYGNVTVLNPNGTQRGDGTLASSNYGWVYAFQGGWQDPATGLIAFGVRWLNPANGTWTQQDPAGAAGSGNNLYQVEGGNTVDNVDPGGTQTGSTAETVPEPLPEKPPESLPETGKEEAKNDQIRAGNDYESPRARAHDEYIQQQAIEQQEARQEIQDQKDEAERIREANDPTGAKQLQTNEEILEEREQARRLLYPPPPPAPPIPPTAQDLVDIAPYCQVSALSIPEVSETAPATTTPPQLLEPPKMLNPWLPGTTSGPAPAGGVIINMAVGPNQITPAGVVPGGFGTTEPIPDLNFVRQNLAVIPSFKPDIVGVQQYIVPEGVQLQWGNAAPQSEGGISYPGGASQVQILNYSDRSQLIPVGPVTPIH